MKYDMKILEMLYQKEDLLKELHNLIQGSVEVRNKDDNKYIYTHYRLDGEPFTMYIGEYSDDLYNKAINDNIRSKIVKKEIKKIDKELDNLGYEEQKLSEEVLINIDFARRHLVDSIYKQAILEGVSATLVDTKNIIEGGIVHNMSVTDVSKIVNLKHAWDFILDKYVIAFNTDYSILCMINRLVEEGFYYTAGRLRTTPVIIGGTSWKPDIPIESDIKEDIKRIVNKKIEEVDIAIELLLYVTKKQMFINGNKRSALIFANHYLISKGKGLIIIPTERIEEYKSLLVKYYETDNMKKIFSFLKKCYIKI